MDRLTMDWFIANRHGLLAILIIATLVIPAATEILSARLSRSKGRSAQGLLK